MSSFNPGPGGDLGANEITTTGKGTFGNVAVSESAAPAAPADGAGGILYCKADGKIYWISNELAETDLTAGGASLTEEQVEDFVGGMVTGGTETGISVTYTDGGVGAGVLNFVVSDTTVAGDSGSTAMTPGDTLTIAGGTNCTTAMSGDTLTVNATGGSDTYTIFERGSAYMNQTGRKYSHAFPGQSTTYESSREWINHNAPIVAYDATTFTASVEESIARWAIFVVPAACTVTSAIAWYKSDQSQNTYISLWQADMSSANDSAGSITWTEMKRATSSGNTHSRSHQVSLTSLSNNTLAAGDLIAVALDLNNAGSAQNIHFQIGIKITPS